ncbi:MAG: hypothetical protein ACJ744_02185 [Gaiellaceae bacterium]
MSRPESTGLDLLLAHVRLLSAEAPGGSPERRVAERVEPALAALLARALQMQQAAPRRSLRL